MLPSLGPSGEADLEVGPIVLKASEGDSSALKGTSTLGLTALTSAATLETPHAAILPPDQGVNTIVMRGEAKDTTTSTSGENERPACKEGMVLVSHARDEA